MAREPTARRGAGDSRRRAHKLRVLDRAADAFTATSTSITLFWSSTLPQSTEVLTEVTVYNKAP